MTVVWDVAPPCLLDISLCFRGAYCLHRRRLARLHGATFQRTTTFTLAVWTCSLFVLSCCNMLSHWSVFVSVDWCGVMWFLWCCRRARWVWPPLTRAPLCPSSAITGITWHSLPLPTWEFLLTSWTQRGRVLWVSTGGVWGWGCDLRQEHHHRPRAEAVLPPPQVHLRQPRGWGLVRGTGRGWGPS
jgi:hypothetical protein